MTSYQQNDYHYNNENDALSYNSRPISTTNYIKNSSYENTTDPILYERGSHQNNSKNLSSMYDNYGSVVASDNNVGGIYGGGLRGCDQNTTNNDNDIYHQRHQVYTIDSYGRGGYYDDSCDNMSDYDGDNRMSGRHSSMMTTAKQLPQIPIKHSSSMVDGISYSRGASLPTTPPVAHKKSRMLPQPTAVNGGIGGSTGKCLPATPRALPQVNGSKQAPTAKSGTGRKLLPTPKQKSSVNYDSSSTSSYDNTTINNLYNNVRPNSSMSVISSSDNYSNYGFKSPTSLHKRLPNISKTDFISTLDTRSTITTKGLPESTMIASTTDDTYYDVRPIVKESSSSTLTSSSSSGNFCTGVGRKLPKRLPTPNLKKSNGSSGKQLPKLPTRSNNFLSTADSSTPSSAPLASLDYSNTYSPFSYTSSLLQTNKSSVTNSSSVSNHISDLNQQPPTSVPVSSSIAPVTTSGSYSSYPQLSKSGTTYSTGVTFIYDTDGNTSTNSYLDTEYHSLKSYPPEIITTAIATATTSVTSTSATTTTTTSKSSSSFSVSDYLKKFDLKSALTTATVSTTTTTTITNDKNHCSICADPDGNCNCFTTSGTTTSYINGHLSNEPVSHLSNGYSSKLSTAISTTNYSSYISDYLKIYSSNDYNYDSGSTLVEKNSGRKPSIIATISTTTTTTTLTTTSSTSYITSSLSSEDFSSKANHLLTTPATPTTCDHNGCEDYINKTYDTIDYFNLPTTTTDYSEYLLPAKSAVVSTNLINGDNLSCYKYFDVDISTAVTATKTMGSSSVSVKSSINNYDDLYSYSPTPTVTTTASNDDPYLYLDAYKVELPIYSIDYGSSTESYALDTYTERNYSTTMSKTRLETSSNNYYNDYRSSTTTPNVEANVITDYKAYLFETNSNSCSGSGSGSGSGSSSNAGSDLLFGKYDVTTLQSSTIVTTENTTISGGYYQPASSKSAPSLNTTSTPQKAASAAASKASSMFGSLSQGLKGGLDGVLTGVAAVADSSKQQQQSQLQSTAVGIKSSAKSFGFGLASKLIPNLSGSSQQTKPPPTTTTTAKSQARPNAAQVNQMPLSPITSAPMTTSYDIPYNTCITTNINENQVYTTINDYDYSDMDHLLTTSSDVSSCGEWNGTVRNSQSIFTTDSLIYDTDPNQGIYEEASTTGGGMIIRDGYDNILTQQSSLDLLQTTAVPAMTSNGGGKIVDYSDDYKYGYDEYSYSENDYIATGDITDNQNYNNNYDYMDDDATIVSQLLDNAAAKMAAEAATTTVSLVTTTTTSLISSFDATLGMDMMDVSMKPIIKVTSATTLSQRQSQQLPAVTSTTTAQSKLGPTSLLSSLTSVATGGQQPQVQQQQPASKTSSSGGGGLFGTFLGKAAAAVQSATQVVSTATAMTTAAVKVVPGTPFSDDHKSTSQMRNSTDLKQSVVSGAGGAAVVTTTTSSKIHDYENSNLYDDDYYATSTTTTNTQINTTSKMLPTVPLSRGKKLPAINGKSGLLIKQQPTEIYDEEEEEYIDELDPNYRIDSEQDDYYMDQTAPSTTASMMAVNGYYTPPDGGYDYREDYFNEEDEYKYLEKEQQLKELRKQQQLIKHQKQPPLEYIEESRDDYIDDNYPSEDSANYIEDVSCHDPSLQEPVVTSTSAITAAHIQQSQAPTTAVTTPTFGGLIHHQIKKQDSIIEEDEDEALLTPDNSLPKDDQLHTQNQPQDQQHQFHEEPQLVKKRTLSRGETEEVTSGNLMRKPEITARQRWNWAYNKIIMQLNWMLCRWISSDASSNIAYLSHCES